jgi:hypothetical protein
MDKDDRVTRRILIIICLLAIAPLVMAALVQIAAHELRCVYDFTKASLKIAKRPFNVARYSR